MKKYAKIKPVPQHATYGDGFISLGKLGEPNFQINGYNLSSELNALTT